MYVAYLGQHRPKLWFTLQIAPNFRQAATLKSLVEDKIAKGRSVSCVLALLWLQV
jgi:hypothetical protein